MLCHVNDKIIYKNIKWDIYYGQGCYKNKSIMSQGCYMNKVRVLSIINDGFWM